MRANIGIIFVGVLGILAVAPGPYAHALSCVPPRDKNYAPNCCLVGCPNQYDTCPVDNQSCLGNSRCWDECYKRFAICRTEYCSHKYLSQKDGKFCTRLCDRGVCDRADFRLLVSRKPKMNLDLYRLFGFAGKEISKLHLQPCAFTPSTFWLSKTELWVNVEGQA